MTAQIKLYTVPEVAAALHVHRNTVDRQIRRKLLRVVRIGRSVRVRESELHAFLDRRQR